MWEKGVAEEMEKVLTDREGLSVTCTNGDALPLYNDMLLVFMSVRESALSLVQSVLKTDPGFVLVHCVLGYMWLAELIPPTDPKVSKHVQFSEAALEGGELSERERRHVEALLVHAEGDLPGAIDHWAAILVRYPRDLIAVRILFVSCIMTGQFEKMRNTLASVLPHWSRDMPSYPFILGFYAFSLEETNYKDRGEEIAREALTMERRNPWATHALSHVIEEARPVQQGVELLTSTREDWIDSLIGSHINWHLALFHLQLGDTDAVLREYDEILVKSVKPDNRLGLLDASSLLWRLNLLGVDTGNRWQLVVDAFKCHVGKHGSTWYDAHLMLSLCHGQLCEETARLALARQMVQSIQEYAENGETYDSSISRALGVPCCNALLAYGEERYDEVVCLLAPLRYDLQRLGGSWAQRQVFNHTMIQAAVNARDIPMAMALVSELKAQKPHAVSLTKLFDSLKAMHGAEQATPTQQNATPTQSPLGTPEPKMTRIDNDP